MKEQKILHELSLKNFVKNAREIMETPCHDG